jgi:iron complex transport system permease protein
MHPGRSIPLLPLLALITLGLSLVALGLGPVRLAPGEVFQALIGSPAEPSHALIIREIRLPRLVLALLIGAMLGLAGAALQGLTRNPLAEPSLFGAPQSAAFAAVALVSFGGIDVLSFWMPVAGIIGALVSVALLVVIAGRETSTLVVILAGLAVSSLAGAATALTMNLAPNFYAALEIAFWLMGSLEDRSFRHVLLAGPFILAGAALLLNERNALRALTLGEDVAATLGVAVERTRWRIIIGVALGVGAAVAVSGAIGFIGLVAPHLIRPLVRHDPTRLLPAAALAGAALLVAADCAVKLTPPAADLKVGVVTALIGAPFFLYLIFRQRRLIAGDAA